MGVNYLIVISILEGRNFPNRHDKLLVVEAKFDGEVMSTDPVQHVNLPDFNTELAWEVDKKGLQMHRLQRTPIKLLWYAVDMELSRKEAIGYMVLDIRLAQEKSHVTKWLPLLNSKYQEKPEVLLSLFLEKEIVQTDPVVENKSVGNKSKSNGEKGGRKKSWSIVPNHRLGPGTLPYTSNALKPVLISNAGYYQIGPPDQCTDNFTFSVTLAFAANLNKLMPSTNIHSSKGYYFYYSLFENEVISETFANLSNPDFPAERASVRIFSSVKILSAFFGQYSTLEILLCCDDTSLGSGIIPLSPLASINKHNIDMEPLCVEGSVQITSYNKSAKHDEDLSPFIGVSVVLQKEKIIDVPKPAEIKGSVSESAPKTLIDHSNSPSQVALTIPESPLDRAKGKQEPQKNEGENIEKKDSSENHIDVQHVHHVITENSSGISSKNLNGHLTPSSDNLPHHFCFTLDLCSFRSVSINQPINLLIRYSYPFFGSTASIVTQPDVEVHPKNEISIPHGYCAFNFATSVSLLRKTFWETQLLLEILHKTKQGTAQEQLVGTSKINLFRVFEAPTSTHVGDSKKQGSRKMSTCKLSVLSLEGREIAEIIAVLTLDDFGLTTAVCEKCPNKPNPTNGPQHNNTNHTAESLLSKLNGLTQEELFQAALELEMWQERQRALFKAQLKEKEMQHLKVLATEWKQRDADREMLLQRKLQECQKLEDKLKQTLNDAEVKEKQLAAQEAELTRKLQNVDTQVKNQQKESNKQIESIKNEYIELLKTERQNVQELTQKKNSLQKQLDSQEAEIRDLKSIIESLKSQLNKQPDIQLKTKISLLNMEKSELVQKLEAMTSAKQKYKYQWSQVLKQATLLQQKVHAIEKGDFGKKNDLEVLQQRILVAEEQNALKKDQETLMKVKDRVNWLHAAFVRDNGQSNVLPAPPVATSAEASARSPNNNSEPREYGDHVQQLIAQRENLLGTGIFTNESRVIQQLNGHIQKAKFSSMDL